MRALSGVNIHRGRGTIVLTTRPQQVVAADRNPPGDRSWCRLPVIAVAALERGTGPSQCPISHCGVTQVVRRPSPGKRAEQQDHTVILSARPAERGPAQEIAI